MKLQLGLALCLFAGCAVRPTAVTEQAPATDATAQASGAAARPQALDVFAAIRRGSPLCLGVEFLPPVADENPLTGPTAVARAEAVPQPPPAPVRPREFQPFGGRDHADRHTWTLSADDLAHARAPIERETLRFLDDLMGEDRRRLRRDIGTPILTVQATDLQSPGIDLRSEEIQAEEEAQYLAEHGTDLLRRPLQLLLRRTPLVEQLEIDLREFKETNVPLSEEYGRAHQGNLGRLSLRVRTSDPQDPVEVVYLRSGVRIGSSQSQLKLGFARHIAKDLVLELRARQDYDDRDWRLRADLAWEVSPHTSLHFVAGDNLDFLTTSTVYSLFESPMDGSPGVLVYAVHLF